jgi:hypothetical protein
LSASQAPLLAGNGLGLVREIALAKRVQQGLERLYRLDLGLCVSEFMFGADAGERETLFVRATQDQGLEVSLRVPRMAPNNGTSIDTLCQLIEGVSHFVYVVHRAQHARETTQLELELQAEVDKYVVLAESTGCTTVESSERLRAQLYGQVEFTHAQDSEIGARYRTANTAANRFLRRLERRHLARARYDALRADLRAFYEAGQEGKLRAA